jgi:hypothetical protein
MLEIEPETVYFLVLKAREFDEKDQIGGSLDPDADADDTESDRVAGLYDGDPVAQEIKDTIDGLNEDHQAELVALTWVGRGDYTGEEWAEALKTARERRSNPTSEYLLGTPMLGDYLEEGLVALGYEIEDLQPRAV